MYIEKAAFIVMCRRSNGITTVEKKAALLHLLMSSSPSPLSFALRMSANIGQHESVAPFAKEQRPPPPKAPTLPSSPFHSAFADETCSPYGARCRYE